VQLQSIYKNCDKNLPQNFPDILTMSFDLQWFVWREY